jgi:hypothetical protein
MSTTDSDSICIEPAHETTNTIKLISITPEPTLSPLEDDVNKNIQKELDTTIYIQKSDPILLTSRPELMSKFLIDILVKNDDIKSFADKITLKVSNKTLEMLKNILSKAPEALDKVVDNLKDILNDGVIDHKDIPKFIILVNNLYKTDLKSLIKSNGMTTTEIVQFIQFILKLVIDLDFVDVNDKVQMFEIIEASGALLEMVIPPQEVKCPRFLSCFCLGKNTDQ